MIGTIKSSEFAKNILKMFTGVLLSQIILVIGNLILARLYTPTQFGAFSLFVSIVSILAILATLRYENTLIILKNNSHTKYILSFLYLYLSVFTIFLIIMTLLLNEKILDYLHIKDIYLYIPLMVLIYALFQIFTNLNVRYKNFKTISKSKILLAFVTVVIQLVCYYLNLNDGLIYGYIIGYFSVLFLLNNSIENSFSFYLNKIRVKFLLKKYSYFVKHALPADFINNLATNITPLLITMWFDIKVAGLYFLGYRIINLPLQLISTSVGKVYFQKVSQQFHINPKKLYSITIKVLIGIVSLITIPLVLLYFYAENIIVFLLGEQWADAGVYLSLLSIMFFFRTLFSPISSIAEVLNKVYIVLFFSIYILIITVFSLYIGHINNNFNLSVLLLSIFSASGYLSLLVYFLKYMKGFK